MIAPTYAMPTGVLRYAGNGKVGWWVGDAATLPKFNAKECAYWWLPGNPECVFVRGHPVDESCYELKRQGWFDAGACWPGTHKLDKRGLERRLLLDFNTMVVRDGISPRAAHAAFIQIHEYARVVSPDVPGAVV